MKVFVAGASGVIGRVLVARLIAKGHAVTAMTRTQNGAELLESLGADAVQCDAYDKDGVIAAVRNAHPDVVVHQLTSLPRAIHPRKIERQLAANDRIRVEGTGNLLWAARRAGARRFIAQSVAFAYAPEGGPVKIENDRLWLDAPWPWRRTVEAVANLEHQVETAAGIEGVILRYGYFYGPGTAYGANGTVAKAVRKRAFPIPGRGSGVFSFVHVDDAAAATEAALDRGRPGVYNIVDDEPSPLRDWLPVYAVALGAPPPWRVFALLARILAGNYGMYMMTRQRGASNARAKKEFGWSPLLASWRTGFRQALLAEGVASKAGDAAEPK